MSFFSFYDNRSWNKWENRADESRRRLAEQQIAPGGPGTILKDIEAFIEFVGPDGLITKSRNASVPADRLSELNQKISHPIALNLKRALLRDYPNLAGLFILLRVMDLLQLQGKRLTLCPEALGFWRSLNPTEQYFALLEALLFHAHSSVLGNERSREDAQAFRPVTFFLCRLSSRWLKFDFYESSYTLAKRGDIWPWNLFLQQQLGLIDIRSAEFSEKERQYGHNHSWLIGAARLTKWGTAIAWALREIYEQEKAKAMEEEANETAAGEGERQLELDEPPFPPASERSETDASDGLDEDIGTDQAPEESEPAACFGVLQPVFQLYFPEWQKVYAPPKREAPTGTHIFKVSLPQWYRGSGGVWRRLAVPPEATLDELAGAILDAFKFDDDHPYDFRYRDHRGRSRVYNHPFTDEGPHTTEITIGGIELPL
ncbi:MAG: plasmid pRiA4b ORF-3 family protein, partial [Candidatus Omnitrophica bacterium]|nr:plasmid pRiA4b ORF-3 family protein [Candidatus Omnitrophota bacterium]